MTPVLSSFKSARLPMGIVGKWKGPFGVWGKLKKESVKEGHFQKACTNRVKSEAKGVHRSWIDSNTMESACGMKSQRT